ncbi:hypothetical protein ACLB2K_019785 [Fragaria x ananassa]
MNQYTAILFMSPRGVQTTLTLGRDRNNMHCLRGGWSRVAHRDNFQVDDVVQLWSYKDRQNWLRFVMQTALGGN